MCKFNIAPESAGLYGAAGDEQSAQEMISWGQQVLQAWGNDYFDQFNPTEVEKLTSYFFHLRHDLWVDQDQTNHSGMNIHSGSSS